MDPGLSTGSWRERLLRVVQSLTAAVGAVAFGIVFATKQVPLREALVLLAVYLPNLICALRPALSYRLRASVLVGVNLLAALVLMARSGPAASTCFTAIGAVVLTGLLFHRRGGALVFGSLLVAWPVVGWAVQAGWLPPLIPQPQSPFVAYGRVAISFGAVAGGLLVSTLYVVRTIEASLRDTQQALADLQAEQAQAEATRRELDDARQDLERAQMFDVVGRLAGGVAHDINNALVVIQGWSDLLRMQGVGAKHADGLDAIDRASANCSRMTRYLLTLGRRDVYSPAPLELAHVVEVEVRTLRRVLPERIRVDCELAPPVHVVADPAQLQQVVLNLCLNARDAMPEGGTLTLAVRASDEYALLEVRDTGLGIAPEHYERLFEPFFTTKGSQGTGLGLAMVRSIAERCGGRIEVVSEVGVGSTFTLRLPLQGPVDTPAPPPKLGEDFRLGAVLVAEDDPEVREVLVLAVERVADEVLVAHDATDALLKLRRHRGQLEALISDGVMPGPALSQLIDAFRELHPGAPVLICSGHLEDPQILAAIQAGGLAFLAKPFTAQDATPRARDPKALG